MIIFDAAVLAALVMATAGERTVYAVVSDASPGGEGLIRKDWPYPIHLYTECKHEAEKKVSDLRAAVFKELGMRCGASPETIAEWLAFRETIRVERFIVRPAFDFE